MNEAIHYFSSGSGEAFPLEAGVCRRVGFCLRMCVGSCLRVQVGMEGASGDVCHVREFTAGAAVRPRSARCLVCIAQRCVTSDAPPDLLTRQSGMFGLPSLPAAEQTSPHPNRMRRAVLMSHVPLRPTAGVSLNDRPITADGGTGCRRNALGSQKTRNNFLGSHRFVPLKPGALSGSGKGGHGSTPVGTHKGHLPAAVAPHMPGL